MRRNPNSSARKSYRIEWGFDKNPLLKPLSVCASKPAGAADIPVSGRATIVGRSRFSPMRILLVEDQFDIRDVLYETLSDAGHSVTLAANYTQAVAALTPAPDAPPDQGGGWDLLLTDLLLPGGSGFDLAVRAQAQSIRVLLCSGHPEQLYDLEQRGIPHLRKPFTLRHLLDQVEAVMAMPGAPPPRPPA